MRSLSSIQPSYTRTQIKSNQSDPNIMDESVAEHWNCSASSPSMEHLPIDGTLHHDSENVAHIFPAVPFMVQKRPPPKKMVATGLRRGERDMAPIIRTGQELKTMTLHPLLLLPLLTRGEQICMQPLFSLTPPLWLFSYPSPTLLLFPRRFDPQKASKLLVHKSLKSFRESVSVVDPNKCHTEKSRGSCGGHAASLCVYYSNICRPPPYCLRPSMPIPLSFL